jgi:flagellar motility protein MotE (MotC chaperone)
MAKHLRSKGSRPAGKRARTPRAEQASQGQIERGVREIGKAIADIQRGLAGAERRIETDARQQIRALQKEARAQMRALEAKRREATRLLGRLSSAAGGSWEDITKTVQTMVSVDRAAVVAVIERFRNVLS